MIQKLEIKEFVPIHSKYSNQTGLDLAPECEQQGK